MTDDLQTASTKAFQNKFVVIIGLKKNIPRNVKRIAIDPNRARFSAVVTSARIAIQVGSPRPKDIPARSDRSRTLRNVAAISRTIIAKEEKTPIKLQTKRICFRSFDIVVREAPIKIEKMQLKNNTK
ncbi:MAG: hypothetical protein QXG39_09645 [Candidatus Aenigmatarchaeota archaeon]